MLGKTCMRAHHTPPAAASCSDFVHLLQFESMLQPLSALLLKTAAVATASQDTVAESKSGAASSRPASAKGKVSTGRPTSAKAAQSQLQPQQLLDLQLLIDPELCPLPWEALSCFSCSCRSIARCFSIAQLQQLLQPPGSTAAQAATAAVGAGGVQAVPAVLDITRLTFIADPLHEASDQQAPPGCYAPPLLPLFRYVVTITQALMRARDLDNVERVSSVVQNLCSFNMKRLLWDRDAY